MVARSFPPRASLERLEEYLAGSLTSSSAAAGQERYRCCGGLHVCLPGGKVVLALWSLVEIHRHAARRHCSSCLAGSGDSLLDLNDTVSSRRKIDRTGMLVSTAILAFLCPQDRANLLVCKILGYAPSVCDAMVSSKSLEKRYRVYLVGCSSSSYSKRDVLGVDHSVRVDEGPYSSMSQTTKSVADLEHVSVQRFQSPEAKDCGHRSEARAVIREACDG